MGLKDPDLIKIQENLMLICSLFLLEFNEKTFILPKIAFIKKTFNFMSLLGGLMAASGNCENFY